MQIGVGVMVVIDRAIIAADLRRVDGRLVGVVVISDPAVVVVIVTVGFGHGFGIGDARELQGVFKPVLGVDDAIGLQRRDDGHGDTGDKLAKLLRQEDAPDLRAIRLSLDSRNSAIVAGGLAASVRRPQLRLLRPARSSRVEPDDAVCARPGS